jgi:hypothetical protein
MSLTAASSEALSLYRSFLRLRRRFPSRGVRTNLRVRTASLFRARHARYVAISESNGEAEAEEIASIWRAEAKEDLGVYHRRTARGRYCMLFPEAGANSSAIFSIPCLLYSPHAAMWKKIASQSESVRRSLLQKPQMDYL